MLLQFPEPLPSKGYNYRPINLKKYKLGLVIGKTHDKDPYIFEMDDTHPSLIISGAPGQGKSNALAVFLRQIEENYTPQDVLWYLVDLKMGVELKRFSIGEYEPYCGDKCWQTGGVPKLLKKLKKEVVRRMELFEQFGVQKIDEYNALNIKKVDEETGETVIDHLPYLLLVIDEYAELRRAKDAEKELQSLIQTGRAAGLKCLLCLQRASATNLSTDIRGLISDRLSFRVPDRTNSEIVLDVGGAESLPCPGRCLLLHGPDLIEAQVMRA